MEFAILNLTFNWFLFFQAHKPMFLAIKFPLDMYEILCIEVHLELNKNNLHKEDQNTLEEFVNQLNSFNPKLSEEFAGKPSRIQTIVDESVASTEKYKLNVNKQKKFMRREGETLQSGFGSNIRTSGNRGRGRGRGGQQNVRRYSNNTESWRSKDNDTEGKELVVELSTESGGDSTRTIQTNSSVCPNWTIRHVQKIRDPYGPYQGDVQNSFERRRVPDIKWIVK